MCMVDCPTKHYINLNARTCFEECKSPLLKAGKNCTSKCPKHLPYQYEDSCYDVCPGYNVGFESKCIHEYDCTEKYYFIYNKVCHRKCPSSAIKDIKTHKCHSRLIYVVLTALFFVGTLISMSSVLFLMNFNGFDHVSESKVSI